MKKIVCIGDSNTYGYDPAALFGGRYPKSVRWTDRLSEGGFRAVNLGENGMSVSRRAVHPLFAQEVKAEQPLQLVTVMLGSNDILLGLSPEETALAMRDLLTLLRKQRAGEDLLLIAPPPFKKGLWVADPAQIQASEALAFRYRKLADSLGLFFADAGRWEIPLAADGVHFTAEGHRLFAEKLLQHCFALYS